MQILSDANGLKLIYKGITLIEHTCERPALYLGAGRETISMRHGNFKIDDEIVQRIPFERYTATQNGSAASIGFLKDDGKVKYTLDITETDGGLELCGRCSDARYNRLWLEISADAGEHVYGLGEQYSAFDLRGRKYPIFTCEQGVGRNKSTMTTFLADNLDGGGGDYWTTYYPEATFISSKKYFLHLHGYEYAEIDLSHSDRHVILTWSSDLKISVDAKQDYIGLLCSLTALVGRQPQLPEWAFRGVWLGMQGGSELCAEKLDRMLGAGMDVSAVWTQDWVGKRVTSFGKRLQWDWHWNKQMYPTLDADIAEREKQGVAWMGYINPYLVKGGELFGEAEANGYFVKRADGSDYLADFGEFDCGFVDLTSHDAFDWYKNKVKHNMIALGLRGWMVDFGEYLPTDCVVHSGQSAMSAHNQWPTLWAKLNYEALEESGMLGKIAFFTRSGATGTQRYSPIMFAGDQCVDWSKDDGLPSVINAALSLAMTGFGMLTFDIGGYTALFDMFRTKELLLRGCEFAAFTPVMRTHEGNRPDINHQFDSDEETVAFFTRFSRIHTLLADYNRELCALNSKMGVPAMRPLMLHYPDDERATTVMYEYLLGRDILVAPVVEQGADSRTLYLPEDNWTHLWSGVRFTGGDVTVSAPVGMPPVFFRTGSDIQGIMEQIRKIK